MTIFEEADARLLPGFERRWISAPHGKVLALVGGTGPALLMLHGDPQTHLCWHHIAPKLTDRFTVVLTDIRGRGETHKPGHDPEQNAYTKRDMAAEQLEVMRHLGHDRFALVAHDRGARVARRLVLDHPDAVTQLVVMDIIPALDFYEHSNAQIAQEYFYFSFLTQDYPVPETLIAGNPEAFLKLILMGLSDKAVHYDTLALQAYLTANMTPEAITAMCECFRAGFHIDRRHDQIDRDAGKKITCPTLVMWGERGVVGKHFDVERIWRDWCEQPQFAAMPSGHFIPEEAPNESLAALNGFLTAEPLLDL
ncbi:fluoroacetate dehalogenase [Roseobacter cerasinus]|uniref:Fluoroacetate dehalogenase n=1 Tax=Roseobacter cerasinus TaxID=2602289 RepID=A0A640VLT4_9RHOB|nr:alpha/beta hydrolase [Roseobacter cerasinus]GFE48350.1 fluoroacetate dehalogenase [Roseobacter cerasinus]